MARESILLFELVMRLLYQVHSVESLDGIVILNGFGAAFESCYSAELCFG